MLTHVKLTAGQEKSQIIVQWLRNVEMSDQTKSESSLLVFRPLSFHDLLSLIKRASKISKKFELLNLHEWIILKLLKIKLLRYDWEGGVVKIIKDRIDVCKIICMWTIEKMLCYSAGVDVVRVFRKASL